MKGTAKFENVQRFRPIGKDAMGGVNAGDTFAYVRNSDYEALIKELKSERMRLKQAGKMVCVLRGVLGDIRQFNVPELTSRKIRRWKKRMWPNKYS